MPKWANKGRGRRSYLEHTARRSSSLVRERGVEEREPVPRPATRLGAPVPTRGECAPIVESRLALARGTLSGCSPHELPFLHEPSTARRLAEPRHRTGYGPSPAREMPSSHPPSWVRASSLPISVP